MKLPLPPTSLRVLLSNAKVVWKHWNVQSMVLTSFIIQLVLILLAPFRKNTSNSVILASIWLAYLLADWVAIQSIGLISNPLTTAASDADGELYAFWAQFLLLHLGGPDTITALALEDNELWLRTGLHLAVQVYVGLGVLVKSVAHSQTSLWLPTLLMFTAGIIKYMERLSSLFHGRLPKVSSLFPDTGGWAIVQGEHKGQYRDLELVRDSLNLVGQHNIGYTGVRSYDPVTYNYMSNRTPEEAFRVLEIQSNLEYEALYTKTALICTKKRWKALRLSVTLLKLGCLVMWWFFTDKEGLKDYNIQITYTLLVGAIVVDAIAYLSIHLLSDWAVAMNVANSVYWKERVDSEKTVMLFFYKLILSARKRTWGRYRTREDAPFWACFRRALFRRWSESIPQWSLLCLTVDEQYNSVSKIMGLQCDIFYPSYFKMVGFRDAWKRRKQSKFISKKWFSNHLRDFLYEDVKEKAKTRGAVENIGKVKGGWACWDLISKYQAEMISIPLICELLDMHGDYYEILIKWHIITELFYNSTGSVNTMNSVEEEKEECNHKEICKTLSNYLMYLLIHREDMLPPPSSDSHQTICDNVVDRLEIHLISEKHKAENGIVGRKYPMPDLYESHNLSDFPIEDILIELDDLEKKRIGKWEFMAKVWSELMYYAAIQCTQNQHAANLKQGGELLSFVWLLLVHMGLGVQGSEDYKPAKALLYESDFQRCSSHEPWEFPESGVKECPIPKYTIRYPPTPLQECFPCCF